MLRPGQRCLTCVPAWAERVGGRRGGAGLPTQLRQEDGSREKYQRFFGAMDQDGSKTIE